MKVCLNCGLPFELEADQKRRVTLFCRECKISEEFLLHLMRRIDGADPENQENAARNRQQL